jgi:hypothetical protein
MSREIPPTRRGYDAREVVSALQKAIRRSQPHEALYWAVELDRSGYGAWCFKRLRVIASEDVGLADPGVASEVRALYENWREEREKKTGEGGLFLAHAVLRLATTKKSRLVAQALVYQASDHVDRLDVPDEALDRHTLRGRRMGRGLEHFLDEASQVRDFDGDLALMETEYKARRLAIERDDPTPSNPWADRVSSDESLPTSALTTKATGLTTASTPNVGTPIDGTVQPAAQLADPGNLPKTTTPTSGHLYEEPEPEQLTMDGDR